jgi:hypothetical protein
MEISTEAYQAGSHHEWDEYVERSQSFPFQMVHSYWRPYRLQALSGRHAGQHQDGSRGDVFQIWLSAELRLAQVDCQMDEFFLSYEDIRDSLSEFGLSASPSKS